MQGDTNARPTMENSVEFAALALEIWKRRYLVFAGAIAFLAIGVLYAFLTKPSYSSQAIIAPKTPKSSMGTGLISQLGGGMGGMLSGQLGLGGSSLERLQVMFTSRDIIESVLAKDSFALRLFPPQDNPQLSMKTAVERVKNGFIRVSNDQKLRVLYISVTAKDSVLARDMVNLLLQAVDGRIKSMARKEAEKNRQYLEEQMESTSDPLIREKIHQLIGGEIEKSIVMGSESFDVLESPSIPLYRTHPNRRQIIVLSFLAGLFMSAALVLVAHHLSRLVKGKPAQGA